MRVGELLQIQVDIAPVEEVDGILVVGVDGGVVVADGLFHDVLVFVLGPGQVVEAETQVVVVEGEVGGVGFLVEGG